MEIISLFMKSLSQRILNAAFQKFLLELENCDRFAYCGIQGSMNKNFQDCSEKSFKKQINDTRLTHQNRRIL